MRVLLIDVNCKQSSTGQIVYDLYSYIKSRGGEAAICYGRGPIVVEPNIFKFGLDWETKLHALLSRITGLNGCFSFFSTRRLIHYIQKYNPDVVHIHELHAYFVNIKPLLEYLSSKGIRVIHTLHSEYSYTGKCGHSVDCVKWKTECDNCPRLHDYVKSLAFDRTNYLFCQKRSLFQGFKNLYLTAPSEWLCNRITESFLKGFPLKLIHNGVNTDIFKPVDCSDLREKYHIESNEKVFLALAPNLMSNSKGGAFIKEIAEMMRDESIRFIMIGVDGESEKIENNVIICGRIYDKRILAKYYSMADAFIICSKRENYPTTCLEAQSCGTPVYGFATGGTAETLLTDASESLVEYGSTSKLVEKLKTVPQKTDQSVSALRELAINNISKERSLKDYYSLYEV